MEVLATQALADGRVARVVMTDRSDGDLCALLDQRELAARRQAIIDAPWTWLRQVHGNDVVVVNVPGEHAGLAVDAAVTGASGAVLAVQVADCVPVALIASGGSQSGGHESAVGVAHAGWRGLASGVIRSMHDALLATIGADPHATIRAVVGPSIGVECYEFGADDLNEMAAQFGAVVIGRSKGGAPALNMAAAVGAELESLGVSKVDWKNPCTSCEGDRFWSHRGRVDPQRQAMLVMLDDPGAP